MQYAMLDPRPTAEATEANNKVLGAHTLGIEVTIPALAAQCGLGNIDPQHSQATGADPDSSAIEDALEFYEGENARNLPDDETILVTVRADLDSVGAMAIIDLLQRGWHSSDLTWLRIGEVAKADRFARGGYPGPHALPSMANPWPEVGASAADSRTLAAITSAVADFRKPLADRVALMEHWLLTGEEPAEYRSQVERERSDMIAALENGTINYAVRANGHIAVVESTHRAATMVGYALAPVVVALNPTFRQGPSDPYKKFTICAFEAGKFADIKAALAELATLEAGWGGSPTIGGSPQGISSQLSLDQVVEVVSRHLK
jgi:hypothetical protein